jgi:stearoyl-CoA desaturase (delta-9 desaturase)
MEKFFYFLTFLTQGSSFLNPRANAIMHRMHHAYSDTEKDPHSPHFFKDVFSMMWKTKEIYNDFVKRLKEPESEFKGNYPVLPWLDKIGDSWITRIAFGIGYTALYCLCSQLLVLPFAPNPLFNGPIQGALVNWCGHKYGYSNFDNGDHSKTRHHGAFLCWVNYSKTIIINIPIALNSPKNGLKSILLFIS